MQEPTKKVLEDFAELRAMGISDEDIKDLYIDLGDSEAEIDYLLNLASTLASTAHEARNNDTVINEQYIRESKSTTRKLGKYFKYSLLLFTIFLFLTNPSLKDFKEFLGRDSKDTRRKNNFLLFSIFEVGNEKFVGILKNFIVSRK